MATRNWQPISDEEFERQHKIAVRNTRTLLARTPQAVNVVYEKANGRFVVELNNGCVFIFPADRVEGLRGAAPELLAEVKPSPSRLGLHWKTLDAHFSLAGLMAGVFGSPQWMGELADAGYQNKQPTKSRRKEQEAA
jgi:hypothetical protein